jgi:hypothetical protein
MSLTLQIDYPEKLPVLLKKSRKDFEREEINSDIENVGR